ncbi:MULTISPECIES: heavy metal translocating P-type ATPase [Jonquetella]|uniref:Heavy metal-translocating P-type ATPase, Cd/Co/Hg/Pb/Zn-transporting n=1 Tax=Jonquetella anthropi DSM 22815 TaxID=885272 RepID=H0UIT1_9BACT|nr:MULTISPECIES: heavy metal translocating P-type ATPase [Jonquetella]EEX48954.1 cadmium-exporting ATPase [Jonquetella anthropi E3_33 E1]EHM12725.1 heavy metal-translocating P-type ATPase, Cd/Co/Hg/Pb/Zn-transporting [Jonquetella anthropi DSM 22815]ERL23400.1 cadmium-exporting ATPase [Jonquetella sp. BV3C21]
MSSAIYRWPVEGLACPDCARKIARELTFLPDVRSAAFDLSRGLLTLSARDGADEAALRRQCQKVGRQIEPTLTIVGPQARGTMPKNAFLGAALRSGLLAGAVLLFAGLCASGALRTFLLFAGWATAGWTTVRAACRTVRRGDFFNEFVLMTAATLGAWCLGQGAEAASVMVFYQLGEALQSLAVAKSRRDIAALMDIRPETAHLLRNGEPVTATPQELRPGDTVAVLPGEKVPADAVVTDGRSSIDSSALTGESLPEDVTVGSPLLGGTLNLTGRLEAKVTAPFSGSAVARVLAMVEGAGSRKARLERFITRFARYYTPAVFAAALLTALLPPLLFLQPWAVWAYRGLVFLVISCPCALVIAVPLTFFAGLGAASRHGVVVKGSTYLEALARVRAAAFDKTGTITTGRPAVTAIRGASLAENDLLALAASLESGSNHPMAQAVVRLAASRGLAVSRAGDLQELPGRGVTGSVNGETYFLGNSALMADQGAKIPDEFADASIHLCRSGEWIGCLSAADSVKPDAASGLKALRHLGAGFQAMVTGDSKSAADAASSGLELDEVKACLLPDEKVLSLDGFRQYAGSGSLIFVGDGINDAPVLAAADVGVAMGGLGSDAAVEASDAVVMNDKLTSLADGVSVAQHTVRVARCIVAAVLAVKAGVMILDLFGLADMWLAVFADVGVTMVAVGVALSIIRWCPHRHRNCYCSGFESR